MPSIQNITTIPAPRVNFIDERTGLMSREWYRFFLNLFTLTGSGNNVTSLEDLQLDSPYASEISSLEEKLNTLTQTVDTQLADTKAQQALDRFDNIRSLLDFAALAPAQKYDNFVDTNYVDFEQLVPHVGAVGRMVWNDTDGTLDLGLKGGNVTLQIGQEQVVRVVNKSGANLVDGQVVYLSGAQGNRVKVDLAVANGSTSLARTVLGLVTEPILNNEEGFVTISGLVRGLNTSAFVDGDVLYLSTTPGAITNVRPPAPTHVVVVGFCVNANPAVGSILVSVQPGYDLEDLSDVAVTSPVNGNLLIYNATAQDWQNNLLTAGSGVSITNGPGTISISATGTGGTVTSVGQTFTGGLISVAGSPITGSGTLALTVAGTSGGIPYFSSGTTWATSAVLAANALMVGGGAGVAPSTRSTGANVLTALGVAVGTAGSFVVNGGVLGTPSSGTVTNLTGTASININGTVGATTANTGAFTSLSYTTTLTGGTGIVNLGSSQFYKDASGNVGIGVTPSYRLHVVGGYSVIGAHNTATLAASSGTGGAAFSWNRSGGSAETNIANIFDNAPISFEYLQKTGASTANTLYKMASTSHIFYISNTERMRIDSSGNVGIGATANASAILDVQSTTQGFRLPNMTTTQKNAITSPAAGLMVFDTTLSKACVYSGAAWETITSI
jgi:hypothetical protein